MDRPARAALVALAVAAAACGGPEVDVDRPAEVATAVDGRVELLGTDTLEFVPSRIVAGGGELTVVMACEDAPHTFVIEATDELVVDCDGGDTGTGTVTLPTPADEETFVFYCSIPGHRTAGMEGVLTVLAETAG